MRTLDGKVVLVTGGTSGIGRAITERLVARGADVVICARDGERLAAVAAELPVDAHVADMTSAEDRERLLDDVLLGHGRLDILVNNAGIGWTGLVEDMAVEDVERMVATNLVGPIDLTRRALPHLLARGDGDILMISSAAAWSQIPPLTVYSATKSGLDGFITGLRREVTARGVRVHSVNPGPVRTEFLVRAGGLRPAEGTGSARLSPGVSARSVAVQVERSLTLGRSRTVAVPRVFGLGRLIEVTPLHHLMTALLAPHAERIGDWGADLRRRAAAPSTPPGSAPATTTTGPS